MSGRAYSSLVVYYRTIIGNRDALPTQRAAIRLSCLQCCGQSAAAVDRCDDWCCPLWSYRKGGLPHALPGKSEVTDVLRWGLDLAERGK